MTSMDTVQGTNQQTPNRGDAQSPGFFSRFTWGDAVMLVILVILVIAILFPFWWVLRTALTSPDKVFTDVTSLVPVETTLFNFERVLGLVDAADLVGMENTNVSVATLNFWLFLRNSFIFSLTITMWQTLFSTMAAYAFARFKFPFRDTIFFIYLMGLMVPAIVLFIPNFVLIRQMGLIGTAQMAKSIFPPLPSIPWTQPAPGTPLPVTS